MSRSRKKVPVLSDYSRNTTRYYKRVASRKVRYYNDHISNGRSYKKLYCSYNIFDFKFYDWKGSYDGYRK